MILELIGQIWLILAALTCYYSARATYREWGYNKPTPQPKEETWRNVRRAQHSRQSKPREELRERPILRTVEIWSRGEAVPVRSQSTAKNNKIRELAAASGNRRKTWEQ
jgi:hypothetical protein